jgi:hypothetical protein
VERQIAPACLDPVTGLITKKVERLPQNITGMPPSVTLLRDPLNEDGLGCDTAICGEGRTTREPRKNRSGHMISWSITDSHSNVDEIDTRSTVQRS